MRPLTEAQQRLLAEPISSALNLSVRTINTLEGAEVFTVEDLLHCCGKQGFCENCTEQTCGKVKLLSISNFGEKTLEEVYTALEQVGFYRGSREEEALARAWEQEEAQKKPRRGARW